MSQALMGKHRPHICKSYVETGVGLSVGGFPVIVVLPWGLWYRLRQDWLVGECLISKPLLQ